MITGIFFFEETQENFERLAQFLDECNLPVTAPNLHRAFENLAAQGELELTPIAIEPPIPAPVPPTISQPTAPQGEESETQIHAVERLPGESSWMAAKRAYGEQQVHARRKMRQEMRAGIQAQAPRRFNTRDLNNQFATLRKPRGKGAGYVIGEEE